VHTTPVVCDVAREENPVYGGFMHSREGLLALIRGGESLTRAARQLGIRRPTIYSWKSSEAAFGEALSQAVGAKRAVKLTPIDPDTPLPDRTELLRRLDAPPRRGSTRATELLPRELPAELAKGDERTVRRLLSPVP
jgi:transposase-like protein